MLSFLEFFSIFDVIGAVSTTELILGLKLGKI